MLNRRLFTTFTLLLLGFFAIFFTYRQYSYGPLFMARVVGRDLQLVVDTLTTIDDNCSILSFDSEQNRLDFFTVKSFIGSEVGPLNLAYSTMWQGPYLQDNPQVQGREYQAIKTKEGVFVIPGDGVKLPGEYVVDGRALLQTGEAMATLTSKGGPLHYHGISFAQKLPFQIGDWPAPEMMKASDEIEGLVEALPFS